MVSSRSMNINLLEARARMNSAQQSMERQRSHHQQIDDVRDNDEAAFEDLVSWPLPHFDRGAMITVFDDATASVTTLVTNTHHGPNDLDLNSWRKWNLSGDDLDGLFRVSRAGELSPMILPMLHLASNNLLPEAHASEVVQRILSASGNSRRLINALISTQSPATKAIARTLLSSAIRSLDAGVIRLLLDTGIDPNSCAHYRLQTPLDIATTMGSLDIVKLLMSYGARVDLSQGPQGRWTKSVLTTAARHGHVDLVRFFHEAEANINAISSPGDGSPLQAAVKSHKLEIVEYLLEAGANINACFSNTTALQIAVETEDLTIVQCLLRRGANVNAPAHGMNEDTALEAAAYTGNLELVDLLLMWGASDITNAMISASYRYHSQVVKALWYCGTGLEATLKTAHQKIALVAGVRCGDYQFVRQLQEFGISVDAPALEGDTEWTTALQVAVANNRSDLVHLLVAFGADVNAPAIDMDGLTALQVAADAGELQLVQFLLSAGADVNASRSILGMMALPAAARADSLEIVQLLLESGANLAEQGGDAVHSAVDSGSSPELIRFLLCLNDIWGFMHGNVQASELIHDRDLQLPRLLLEHGVLDKSDALRAAIDLPDLEFARLLLQSGTEFEVCVGGNFHPLEIAAINGNLNAMNLLFEYGANAKHGALALQALAGRGTNRIEAARFLLDLGADPNDVPVCVAPQRYFGRTALQGAAGNGDLELVQLLLDNGADVESKTRSKHEGATALQLAAIAGSITVANELIQRGANVNAGALGKYGRTALEGAAENGRLDMVQLLLNLEAEVRGSRALQFARDEGHDGVVNLLLQNGFEENVCMSG
jgi:ankyrin repeat protein